MLSLKAETHLLQQTFFLLKNVSQKAKHFRTNIFEVHIVISMYRIYFTVISFLLSFVHAYLRMLSVTFKLLYCHLEVHNLIELLNKLRLLIRYFLQIT